MSVSLGNLSVDEGSNTSGRRWVLSQRLTTVIGRNVSQLSDEARWDLHIPPFCPAAALRGKPPSIPCPECSRKTSLKRKGKGLWLGCPLILSKCRHPGGKYFRECDTRARKRALRRAGTQPPGPSPGRASLPTGPLSPGVASIVLGLEWGAVLPKCRGEMFLPS